MHIHFSIEKNDYLKLVTCRTCGLTEQLLKTQFVIFVFLTPNIFMDKDPEDQTEDVFNFVAERCYIVCKKQSFIHFFSRTKLFKRCV